MARLNVLLVALAAVAGSLAQNSMDPQCEAATILAQGIALNIADQKNELAATAALNQIFAGGNVDMAKFTAAKNNLLTFINNGIAIRQMNQLIAPRQNKAVAGLDFVANAQLAELGLATNLTGNPANDKPILQTLQMDFTGGIQKNMQNMADAMANCGGTAAVPKTGGNGTTN